MAVAAPGVHVKKVGEAEFPEANFQPPYGDRGGEMKLIPVDFDALVAQRNNLPQHEPSKVGRLRKGYAFGRSHCIQVGVTGKTEGTPYTTPGRIFQVREDLRRMGKGITGIEGQNVRGGALRPRSQAVSPAVLRWERWMPLKNDVGLTRDPIAARL